MEDRDAQPHAGPLAQLLWKLATDMDYRKSFVGNKSRVLKRLGLAHAEDAIFGRDPKKLVQLLREEDEALDKVLGHRPDDGIAKIVNWPPGFL